jgi:hypothetical protein
MIWLQHAHMSSVSPCSMRVGASSLRSSAGACGRLPVRMSSVMPRSRM